MLDTLEMLSKVLDRKQYGKTIQVISQLFMGHKYDFEEDGLTELRAVAHRINRKTEKEVAAQIYKEFDKESDVFGFCEHYRCTQMHDNPELKLKFYKFLLNITEKPESIKDKETVLCALSIKDDDVDTQEVPKCMEQEAIEQRQKETSSDGPFAILDNDEVITILKGGKKDDK